MTFREQLLKLGACDESPNCGEALSWVGKRTLAECAAREGVEPAWAVWLAGRLEQHLPPESRKALLVTVFDAADRAVRVYAVEALENAGLGQEAATLDALPRVVDEATAELAAQAADAASDAATGELAANAAASTAAAERAAAAVARAARSALSAAVTEAETAAVCAGWGREERARQLADLRAALPLEVLETALTKATVQ